VQPRAPISGGLPGATTRRDAAGATAEDAIEPGRRNRTGRDKMQSMIVYLCSVNLLVAKHFGVLQSGDKTANNDPLCDGAVHAKAVQMRLAY
jgi:hypothetical protein